jgi:lysozyme
MEKDRLIAQLITDEGKRNMPYRDTVGKLTIGVGRNLDDRGLSDDEIAYLLSNDLKIVERELDVHLTWWRGMCDARQNVVANMAFNMGVPTLKTFKITLQAMRDGRYADAADGMLKSRWATQVGERANRLAKIMRTGEFSS